jgi:signal transduction histidine kinase
MQPKFAHLTTLVIDDDEDMRRSIVSYLDDSGFTVYQAYGGKDGIEKFDQARPNIVFTDLMMPEVDGLAVLKAIKLKSPETPVVVISGNGSVNYAIDAVREGAWDYITKPILDFSALGKLIDQVLDRAHAIKSERWHQESLQKWEAAGTIAHDFKNILTGIVGNLSLAQMHLEENHQSTEALKRVEKASSRANDLAQKLMNLSKPAVKGPGVAKVADAIQECLALCLLDLPIKKWMHICAGIPPAAIEEGELCQVLNNLILNSAQAMPEGGELSICAETVTLASGMVPGLATGEYVLITIADTGCGITKDLLGRVFEPHVTSKQSGNGLGLASVKKILEQHRGAVAIESDAGRGTSARVYLPIAVA